MVFLNKLACFTLTGQIVLMAVAQLNTTLKRNPLNGKPKCE